MKTVTFYYWLLIYNGDTQTYYYVQGDVVGLLNASGSMVVHYTYDPWGKPISVTDGSGTEKTAATFIGNINPLRYRSYYYDSETGFYYLQSRYYDPNISRFLNADSYDRSFTI